MKPGFAARPDRFLLVAGLLFGLGLAVVTPPFQSPDEPAHFYRAYRLSEGRLDLIPRPGRTGGELPASVARMGTVLKGDLPGRGDRKIAPETIVAALRVPLAPERRISVWFPNSLQYPFIPYVPQALGIALGRACGAQALALLYLARLANLLAGTLMVVLAVRRLPAFQWLATMIALTPMALFLRASASADVTSTGAAFLVAATAARLAWGTDGLARRRDLALLTASSIVLCAAKAVYFPLAFLAFLIPGTRFVRGRRSAFLAFHSAVSLAVTAFAVVTSRAVGIIRFDVAVDPGRQIREALAQPLRFLGVVAADYAVHAPRYLAQLVGKLGWLDTKLPAPFLAAYLAVLLALVFVDARPEIEVRSWQRAFVGAVILATLVLVSASQYAVWTPYGARFVDGLQGRYFTPLVPAAVWALHGRRLAERIPLPRLGMGLALFSVLSFGISAWSLISRYYLFHQ